MLELCINMRLKDISKSAYLWSTYSRPPPNFIFAARPQPKINLYEDFQELKNNHSTLTALCGDHIMKVFDGVVQYYK